MRLRIGGNLEPLSPSSFLYVAERFNLIQEIDCRVTRRAIDLIAEYAGARGQVHRRGDGEHRLRGRGCRFALDDFGAGFGAFCYLKSLPSTTSRSTGTSGASSPMDQLVVEAIVGIAKGMGKKTIAEFVPDEATRQLLKGCGVD